MRPSQQLWITLYMLLVWGGVDVTYNLRCFFSFWRHLSISFPPPTSSIGLHVRIEPLSSGKSRLNGFRGFSIGCLNRQRVGLLCSSYNPSLKCQAQLLLLLLLLFVVISESLVTCTAHLFSCLFTPWIPYAVLLALMSADTCGCKALGSFMSRIPIVSKLCLLT